MTEATPRLLALLLAVTSIAILASNVSAFAAVTFKHLRSTNQIDILLIQGEFEATDDLRSLTHELDTFPTRLISFHSTGGDRSAAMAFGRQIRGLGLTTLQISGSTCRSSCLLAYLGGVERYAEPGSVIIWANSFADEGQGTLPSTLNTATLQYLSEMGVAAGLLDFSLALDPRVAHALTVRELHQFRVVSDTAQRTDGATNSEAMGTSESVETALEFYRQFNLISSGSKSTATTFLKNSYADTVLYYGKSLTAEKVLIEKQAFADRWPSRIYTVRTGSARASCSNTCAIFGVVDWYASSSARKKSASGSVNLALVWNPTTGKIIAETGKVVETDKGAKAPDRITRRWLVDSTNCTLSREKGTVDTVSCQSQTTLAAELRDAGWCPVPFGGWQPCP
jgi:hypothetical protein